MGNTEDTQSTDGPDPDPDSMRRSRSQFPMYLSDELQETVNDRFNKFNARRELDDKPQVEKHRHFLEGLVRAGLEHDELEAYVLAECIDE